MIMTSRKNAETNPNRIQTSSSRATSIRDDLEKRAWILNPRLARRMAKRHRHYSSCDASARRIMRWQDRTLLTLGAVLLALFVIRTETALAAAQVWGLQLKSDTGMHTELAIDTGIQLDITGLVARVEITQRFTNRSSYWAEGIYRFPLPQGAAVEVDGIFEIE